MHKVQFSLFSIIIYSFMPNSSIYVKHPTTGQEINVAPLLLALSTFDAPCPNASLAESAKYAIQRINRVLNLTEHNYALNSPGLLVDVYQDLHRLEDAFGAMKEKENA